MLGSAEINGCSSQGFFSMMNDECDAMTKKSPLYKHFTVVVGAGFFQRHLLLFSTFNIDNLFLSLKLGIANLSN